MKKTFTEELESLINRHGMENGSDTPDFILATFLRACLRAWDLATVGRERWYGRGRQFDGGTGDAPVDPTDDPGEH